MLIILVLTIVDSMDPLRSKCVRGPRRRGFVLIAQLLLSQMPEFIFPTFGSAGFLPKLIRSCLDFFFARFGHYVSPIGAQPHPQGWGLSSGDLQSMETGLPRFKSTRTLRFLAALTDTTRAYPQSLATRSPACRFGRR